MVQDDTDSESGLPETVSLSTSASAAKGHDHALRSFHAAEKRKIREKNRRHDERLKAQAHTRRRVTATTGKGRLYVGNHGVETGDNEGGREMDPHPHWRITRAVGDAGEEEEDVDSGNTSEEEWGGIDVADGGGFQVSADEDVEMSGEEEREEEEEIRNGDPGHDDHGMAAPGLLTVPGKYLPDHLFIVALSKPKPKNDVRPGPSPSRTMPKTRSRPPRKKDVVVDTRTVRTLLSSPASAHLGMTLPPARINKFLANALRFKGKSKGKGASTIATRWERRPFHLGVMKPTTGAPVARFARASGVGASSLHEKH